MKKLSLSDINDLRKKNLRPVVVGCFIYHDKILFVYNAEHDLWQLPQGGIENKENLEDAFLREMSEEIGEDFVSQSEKCHYFSQDDLLFPEHLHGSRQLETDEGDEMLMKGKAYLFCKTSVDNPDFDITKSEFDRYKWVELSEAREFVVENIYQKGKKKITLYALSAIDGF